MEMVNSCSLEIFRTSLPAVPKLLAPGTNGFMEDSFSMDQSGGQFGDDSGAKIAKGKRRCLKKIFTLISRKQTKN